MALPTRDELKALLRIQHDAEDTLLESLLLSAEAMVEAYLHRPIASTECRAVDCLSSWGTNLMVPVTPTGPLTSVTHDDGTVLDVAELQVEMATGLIRRPRYAPFHSGTYTIVYQAGLSQLPNYGTRIEPVIRQAILDVAVDLYTRRHAATASESDGGLSASFENGDRMDAGMPGRTALTLAPFRMVEVA